MTNILLILIFVLLILTLFVFVFAVGFFVGFTRENKRLYKKAVQGEKVIDNKQKAREEKAKRDWQRFLRYDGSNNTDGVTGK